MTNPTTAEVIAAIGKKGVIVGSFPTKGLAAKDVDVVIAEAPPGERNPVLQDLVRRYPHHFESESVGHVFVRALPLNVEVFEGKMPVKGADKMAGRMTFATARRRARRIDCFGVEAWGVVPPETRP